MWNDWIADSLLVLLFLSVPDVDKRSVQNIREALIHILGRILLYKEQRRSGCGGRPDAWCKIWGGLMEELRLLKHLVAKTDATPGFCSGCSSLDARSHGHFRFDLVSNSLHRRSKRRLGGFNDALCVTAEDYFAGCFGGFFLSCSLNKSFDIWKSILQNVCNTVAGGEEA